MCGFIVLFCFLFAVVLHFAIDESSCVGFVVCVLCCQTFTSTSVALLHLVSLMLFVLSSHVSLPLAVLNLTCRKISALLYGSVGLVTLVIRTLTMVSLVIANHVLHQWHLRNLYTEFQFYYFDMLKKF